MCRTVEKREVTLMNLVDVAHTVTVKIVKNANMARTTNKSDLLGQQSRYLAKPTCARTAAAARLVRC